MSNNLADRCEAASGADRELDAAIYYDVLGYCRHQRKERSGAQSDTGFDCLDCGADSWGNRGKMGQKLHDSLPAYTASIDAALTLVPEGASWQMRWWSGDKKCWLTFYPPGDAEDDYFHIWEAATPALALCAAALRAKDQANG